MERRGEMRALIRAWVLEVAESRNMTPTRVAVAAGLAPSTVLRAIDVDSKNTLSTDSIDKIVRATGATPPRISPQNGATSIGFGEPEAIALLPTACPAEIKPKSADQTVWNLRTRAVEMPPFGYLPGDLVLLDASVAPRDRDVVCANRYDIRRGTAETIWRVYSSRRILYTATTDPAIDATPELVDEERVVIKGVLIRALRERR